MRADVPGGCADQILIATGGSSGLPAWDWKCSTALQVSSSVLGLSNPGELLTVQLESWRLPQLLSDSNTLCPLFLSDY